MKNTNKKGFTIVELVIVIAVIAILAAVLIPTFASIIKKANLSADQQAVRQMNMILAAEGAVTKNNIFDVYDALSESGFDAKDYKALTSGAKFYWDAELDRILLVDANDKVIFPAEYSELSLSGRVLSSLINKAFDAVKPDDSKIDDSVENTVTYTIGTPQEYIWVVEQFNGNDIAEKNIVIDLNDATLDMRGSSIMLTNAAEGYISDKNITIKNGIIKNITSVDAAYKGTGGDGHDGIYFVGGLLGSVTTVTQEGLIASTATIENVTIENAQIRNTHAGNVGIIAAYAGSTVTIDTVTVKDSTVIGHRTVGGLIGQYAADPITFKGTTTMDNVTVGTVGGRSGLIIGAVQSSNVNTITFMDDESDASNKGQIVLKNGTHLEMYKCEQNTGNGLGYDETTNMITSYALEYNPAKGEYEEKEKTYYFFEDAYCVLQTGGGQTDKSSMFDGHVVKQ